MQFFQNELNTWKLKFLLYGTQSKGQTCGLVDIHALSSPSHNQLLAMMELSTPMEMDMVTKEEEIRKKDEET